MRDIWTEIEAFDARRERRRRLVAILLGCGSIAAAAATLWFWWADRLVVTWILLIWMLCTGGLTFPALFKRLRAQERMRLLPRSTPEWPTFADADPLSPARAFRFLDLAGTLDRNAWRRVTERYGTWAAEKPARVSMASFRMSARAVEISSPAADPGDAARLLQSLRNEVAKRAERGEVPTASPYEEIRATWNAVVTVLMAPDLTDAERAELYYPFAAEIPPSLLLAER